MTDVFDNCICGVSRELEILHHDEDLESFYSSFVALATHYICVGICSCMYSVLYLSLFCNNKTMHYL